MVRHRAFGQGMVLSVQPMGGDALAGEIAFDNVGTKRLMLKAASAYLEKLSGGGEPRAEGGPLLVAAPLSCGRRNFGNWWNLPGAISSKQGRGTFKGNF